MGIKQKMCANGDSVCPCAMSVDEQFYPSSFFFKLILLFLKIHFTLFTILNYTATLHYLQYVYSNFAFIMILIHVQVHCIH